MDIVFISLISGFSFEQPKGNTNKSDRTDTNNIRVMVRSAKSFILYKLLSQIKITLKTVANIHINALNYTSNANKTQDLLLIPEIAGLHIGESDPTVRICQTKPRKTGRATALILAHYQVRLYRPYCRR